MSDERFEELPYDLVTMVGVKFEYPIPGSSDEDLGKAVGHIVKRFPFCDVRICGRRIFVDITICLRDLAKLSSDIQQARADIHREIGC